MLALYLAVAVLLTALVAWAYFTAQRLNRLHIRTDAALQALQSALDRRAALAAVILPETAALASDAEEAALEPEAFDERAVRERRLANSLPEHLPAPLVNASTRIQLAQRFYNDAVRDTRALRLRPSVRMLRLGGTARLPEYFVLGHPERGSERPGH